jgi:hypothetical protein
MEIGKKFNTVSFSEYFFYIDNYKKYKDFNALGLYRSIVENQNLSIEERILVRDHAHKTFRKSFDFFQLKDPQTFIDVEYLGKELTKGDEQQIWSEIRKYQQKVLADKRIKHRSFGTYSKHRCPYSDCIWQGVMVRQGSRLAEMSMHFTDDKREYAAKIKSYQRKSDRKNQKQIVRKEMDAE